MQELMIECTRTGRRIPTGIMTDAHVFQAFADFQAKTFCPYCRKNHFWSKKEVCLEFDVRYV